MSYTRVIPRDLFNEAQLLKCLGRVALLIADGLAPKGLEIYHEEPHKGFIVEQDESSGDIYCRNMRLATKHGRECSPRHGLNSREPWALTVWSEDDDEIEVFDAEGNLTPAFLTWAEARPE